MEHNASDSTNGINVDNNSLNVITDEVKPVLKRVSVDIDDTVVKSLKALAAEKGMLIGEIYTAAGLCYLEKEGRLPGAVKA